MCQCSKTDCQSRQQSTGLGHPTHLIGRSSRSFKRFMGYSRKGGVDCQSRRVFFVSTSKRSRKGRLPSGDAPPPMRQQRQLSGSLSDMRSMHQCMSETTAYAARATRSVRSQCSRDAEQTDWPHARHYHLQGLSKHCLYIKLHQGGMAMTSNCVRQVSQSRRVICKDSACTLGCLRAEEPALASQAASPCMMSWPVPSTLAMT